MGLGAVASWLVDRSGWCNWLAWGDNWSGWWDADSWAVDWLGDGAALLAWESDGGWLGHGVGLLLVGEGGWRWAVSCVCGLNLSSVVRWHGDGDTWTWL